MMFRTSFPSCHFQRTPHQQCSKPRVVLIYWLVDRDYLNVINVVNPIVKHPPNPHKRGYKLIHHVRRVGLLLCCPYNPQNIGQQNPRTNHQPTTLRSDENARRRLKWSYFFPQAYNHSRSFVISRYVAGSHSSWFALCFRVNANAFSTFCKPGLELIKCAYKASTCAVAGALLRSKFVRLSVLFIWFTIDSALLSFPTSFTFFCLWRLQQQGDASQQFA